MEEENISLVCVSIHSKFVTYLKKSGLKTRNVPFLQMGAARKGDGWLSRELGG